MKDLIGITEASKLLKVSDQTLRRWEKIGKIKPQRDAARNARLYNKEELLRLKQTMGVIKVGRKKGSVIEKKMPLWLEEHGRQTKEFLEVLRGELQEYKFQFQWQHNIFEEKNRYNEGVISRLEGELAALKTAPKWWNISGAYWLAIAILLVLIGYMAYLWFGVL